MNEIVGFLEGFNIQTIISMVVVFWYFTRDIKAEMKILEAKMDKQSDRTDRLYEMFIDLLKDRKKGP